MQYQYSHFAEHRVVAIGKTMAVCAIMLLAHRVDAEVIAFAPDLKSAGWRVATYPGIAPARFWVTSDGSLQVLADRAVGWVWHPVQSGMKVETAQWSWRVEQGVAASDLTQRGKDDRALAVYFVFGREADASKNLLDLLRSNSTKALVYVFGGDQPRGSVVVSPHMGDRGKFIVLRRADAPRKQWLEERVELPSDFARAFGGVKPLLIAIAVSSDSDDTQTINRARLRNLRLD